MITLGKYKHGRPDEEIEISDFKEKLEHSNLSLHKKAYAVLLYWLGCRRTELLGYDEIKYSPCKPLRKESITVKDETILIKDLVAKKHGHRANIISIPVKLYGLEYVLTVWTKTKKGKLLFPFSDSTAYRIIKQLYPKKSPHWFRHNRITKIRRKIDGKTFGLDDAKSFTGIKSDRNMSNYGMTTNEGAKRVSNVLAEM